MSDRTPAPTTIPAADRAACFAARYAGATDAPGDGPWSPVVADLMNHRSVRGFLPDPLAAGTLETLVGAAQSAASSSNLQSWSVVAVEDPARRARLAEWSNHQRHIAVAPLFLVFVADLSRASRLAAARVRPAAALDRFDMLLVAVTDAAIAAERLVVAAEALGLGTVYIGALRNRMAEVAAELALPRHALPLFGLSIGHPDPAVVTAVKPRLPQALVLHRERYVTPDDEADRIAAYDGAMRAFEARQGMAVLDWSDKVLNRVADAASLGDRAAIGAVTVALGFGMT
jgi:nitroreductase